MLYCTGISRLALPLRVITLDDRAALTGSATQILTLLQALCDGQNKAGLDEGLPSLSLPILVYREIH